MKLDRNALQELGAKGYALPQYHREKMVKATVEEPA